MVSELSLQVEVVGCPTVCRHCWAQGISYPAMPVNDVAWVLEQAQRFCDGHGLGLGAYPMHELAAHPQAAEIMRLFADHADAAEFEPFATTGVPLATRGDWYELLRAAARHGTTTVWVAFHGVGHEHDRQVNRSGAYAETCLAIQRVHAAGLRAGCNVFVTMANAPQAERLLATLQRLEVDEIGLGTGELPSDAAGPPQRAAAPRAFNAGPARRPRPPGQPLPSRRLGGSGGPYRGGLDGPRDGRGLAAGDPPRRRGAGVGVPAQPRPPHRNGRLAQDRLGNLRADGAPAVLDCALDHGGRSPDGLWFGPGRLPSVAELAAQHADPAGQGVHFSGDSIRFLWLDRAKLPMHAIGP